MKNNSIQNTLNTLTNSAGFSALAHSQPLAASGLPPGVMAAGIVFGRLAAIYGRRWTSQHESLDQAFTEWESMLVNAELPAEILSRAIDHCRSQLAWPPVPAELLAIARQVADPATPTLEAAIRALIRAAHAADETLADAYQHPLVLAIASSEGYDAAILRTGSHSAMDAHVRPRYNRFLECGWPDWPPHAHEKPSRVGHRVDHAAGLAAIRALRGKFSWLGGGLK